MGKTAFVFSGQGAQAVGMAHDLAETYPRCRALFERADDVLGYALSRIVFEGPDEQLTRTNHCQPGIFVASVAAWAALEEAGAGVAMDAAAGLSLGEWTALHAAGAIDFDDALRALEARGRFMQEACEAVPGAMVSIIGLDQDAVEAVAGEAGVGLANINSPGQIVLSGAADAVERAAALATEAGAKRALVLNVAGAYHSPLMAPAAAQLAGVLEAIDIRTPRVPVMSNVTGAAHGEPDEIRALLVQQVTSCVEWVKCVESMRALGVARYVECGPGKVLTGLIKRIDRGATLHNIQDRETLDATLAALAK